MARSVTSTFAGADMHGYQVTELLGQDIRVLNTSPFPDCPLPRIKGWKGVSKEA